MQRKTRVGNKRVNLATKLSLTFIEKLSRMFHITHVSHDIGSGRADLSACGLKGFLVSARDADKSALGGEALGHGKSDASPTAGYDNASTRK
ncbi:hypothetical protein BSAE_1669 [Bifidobacterium pullorum subsp. saeculare DSM 6531 = LMG 14934]|uniref:Uncharacterized protein n=1 Tax=Bifidobacterium pullorum subsp. saeculare DSM 6531 = LMG 14934 TaxID=1437611 RepID=A0A087CTF6_9BIFI|nr:hypothetical protein BSAE_1669 [Bifidobacterium pullorum subsp. saeculare DSM 6531 = LMG 14934]